MDRVFIKLGSVMAFLSVLMGAFGAHALKSWKPPLSPLQLEDFQIGAQYQMYHALGLILVGLCIDRLGDSKNVRTAGWVLFAGIICFSGSLYAFALTGKRAFGALAPIGGTCFMVGWLLLAAAAWKAPKR
ncbi:MAG: rane protein [Chthonomonadales bacterium]|nr:rane protein [Chthonomonadales bacterium]